MAKVYAEMQEKERLVDLARQARHFETTTKADYSKKDYQQNTIGRRQMKNQDGNNISMNERDEQLIVEHGIWRRGQKTTDEELY
jgi:hypothetical protein